MAALPPPFIQLQPPGLLGLLGIQNGGKAPTTMVEAIQPTFDLQDWYLRSRAIVQSAVATPLTTALTTVAEFTVPNGQWWYVQRYSSYMFVKTGDAVEQLATHMLNQGVGFYLDDPSVQAVAATDKNFFRKGPGAFWAPPGSALGYVYSATVAAALSTIQGRIMYTPLLV